MNDDHIYIHGRPDYNILDALHNAKVVAIDLETSGTNVAKDVPFIIGASIDGKSGVAVPFGYDLFPWRILEDDKVLKIAHNATFDRSMLKRQAIWTQNYADTLILAHMLWNTHLDLKYLYSECLGKELTTFTEIGGFGASEQYLGVMCASHATATIELWNELSPGLSKWGFKHLFWDIQMPLIPIISDMEINGSLIDQNELNVMREEFTEKLEILERVMNKAAGIDDLNYSSGDQVAWLLFKKLGLKGGHKTPSGKRLSTDAEALESLRGMHVIIPLLIKHREYEKLLSTYIEGISKRLVDGRIHTNFRQTGTRTGRLSSTDPNLQNIPQRKPEGRRIRKAFIAPEGSVLVAADKDQLELRELAIQSKDKYMIDAFVSGRDIHTETAIRAYGTAEKRFEGKTLNYTIAFGGGSEHKDKFFEAYPGAAAWIKRVIRQGSYDCCAITRQGRIRKLDNLLSDNPKYKSHGERELLSTMIQGSAAEEVQMDMYKVWKVIHDTEVKLLLQVHDELVVECPKSIATDVAKVLKDGMTSNEQIVPLTCEVKIGDNWRDMKKIKFD